MAIDSCPDEAFSQPPSDTQSTPGFSDEGDGLRAYDNFSGVTGPITGIVWWGGGLNPNECDRNPDNYEVSFYSDGQGQPGDLLVTREVTATVTSTEFDGAFGTILRHEATFDETVNLSSGWVSVFGVDFTGCYFYWANAVDGDGMAYTSGGGSVAVDFAFCLTSEGTFAEATCAMDAEVNQEPLDPVNFFAFSDDSDLTAAADNFSGVTEPIIGLTWCGGGTVLGEDCSRNPDFNITFYENNGGQPGTEIATETVVASAAPTGQYVDNAGFLYRYEAALMKPLDIDAGWVEVQGANFQACFFYWAGSPDGDSNAYSSINGNINGDFAFCLITDSVIHTADQSGDSIIDFSELLRVIQFYNAAGFGCEQGTEDGYAPDDPDQTCDPHAADYVQDWRINLSELLRMVQLFNAENYYRCPAEPQSEDGFCAGTL
jgi:hypothetical protein